MFDPVVDLIRDPPEDDPYQQLMDRLCTTNQQADFHRVEKPCSREGRESLTLYSTPY
jgi:hypothetical protein